MICQCPYASGGFVLGHFWAAQGQHGRIRKRSPLPMTLTQGHPGCSGGNARRAETRWTHSIKGEGRACQGGFVANEAVSCSNCTGGWITVLLKDRWWGKALMKEKHQGEGEMLIFKAVDVESCHIIPFHIKLIMGDNVIMSMTPLFLNSKEIGGELKIFQPWS